MTPTDDLVYIDRPPDMLVPDIDLVHVSVAFTYDIPKAERLATAWRAVGVPVAIGGPAYGKPSGRFIPNLHLREGAVISSRGCPNHCWFCSVWRREPKHIQLKINDGYNIMDDNLLACSDDHLNSVFDMLGRQKERPKFTGGLEAAILKEWHVERIAKLKPKVMYFAYDTPNDLEPLIGAGKMLKRAGYSISDRVCACYVLIGYEGDTFENAENRIRQTIEAGFFPYAMLYKDEQGHEDKEWRRFQREWCNPIIVGSKIGA